MMHVQLSLECMIHFQLQPMCTTEEEFATFRFESIKSGYFN